MDKTTLGKSFEQRVAGLLRSSTGYKNIREQQHIRGMNVDIIFQKQWNPHKNLTIGVECKNWKAGLHREALKSIAYDYEPLLKNKDIDELWIITPEPASATVQEHTDGKENIVLLHITELEQDIIDFSIYARHLHEKFSKDALAHYYIPSRILRSKDTLHHRITDWLESDTNQPVAIWAGYGMGKTSYAVYLASTLASKYLSDATSRIPILIPLGDYYTAPRLDGLFANVLTRDAGVHGYNFNTFWNLHEAGRFVIILDGFDEMKHAMTRAEFISVSKEIRRLILDNSKVMLLGRPDVITSLEEHRIITKGRRRISNVEVSDDIPVEFNEMRIDFFKKKEYLEFVSRYIEYFYRGPNRAEFKKKRLAEIANLRLNDILRRPVQARMLAQIMLNPENSIEKLSKYELYNIFIGECIAREYSSEEHKHQRRKTDEKVRRRFMQELAWWLWAFKRTRTFTIDEIPSGMLSNFITGDTNPEGQIRELLVGSLVEERAVGSVMTEKDAGTFYFPHLSFTEFLVAEYLTSNSRLSDRDFSVLPMSLGGEVKSFLKNPKGNAWLYGLYKDIEERRGSIDWVVVSLIAECSEFDKAVPFKRNQEWPHFAVAVAVLVRTGQMDDALKLIVNVVGKHEFRNVAVCVQTLYILASQGAQLAKDAIVAFVGAALRGINLKKFSDMIGKPQSEYRIASDTEQYCVDILRNLDLDLEGKTFKCNLDKLRKPVFEPKYLSTTLTTAPTWNIPWIAARAWLSTQENKEAFDRIIQALVQRGGGQMFEPQSNTWGPARSRISAGSVSIR